MAVCVQPCEPIALPSAIVRRIRDGLACAHGPSGKKVACAWYAFSVLLSLIHISEPTRLGMISYAVFCLKKKKKKKTKKNDKNNTKIKYENNKNKQKKK